MSSYSDDLLLFSDQDLVAINKPSGLLSLPDGYDPTLPHLRSVLEPRFGRLWIVHRLDRETSGVVVLARNAAAHRSLNTQFERHTVSKVYHALVTGNPCWMLLHLSLPLRPDGDRRHRTVVDFQRGKAAETKFRLLEQRSDHALIEATPRTGRTHQIRVHLAALGYPILSDRLYGETVPHARGGLDRLGLHALALEIQHPDTGRALHIHAPSPPEFSVD